ncbi:MAG: hypothetical protein Athens071426_365 [Parcubacteria group bacterium Athens0714_26]|nr:MAG: hypothetical protein Athens101426_251 [Parcubacteria group bacterium Athens1014_26]TSD02877.1 MAG: hypothetical protein Athens071426_365 [Parcubacteria group bacterium Athens0714_26]
MLSKIHSIKTNKLIICLLVFFAVFVFIVSLQKNNLVSNAQVNPSAMDLSGWAWSDNIGWISFNCNNVGAYGCAAVNYKVTVDNDGNLTGWAWSENIGWIMFNPPGSYPETPNYSSKVSDSKIVGWARACAGTVGGDCVSVSRSDGWDGWIKMSGVSTGGDPYGLSVEQGTGKIIGFAWGGEVMGWMSFSGDTYYTVINIPISCAITADPNSLTIVPPDTFKPVTLSWDCGSGGITPDSVTIDNGVGSVGVSGSKIINVSKTTTFNLTAEKFGISKIFSTTINAKVYDVKIKEVKP